MSQRTTNHTQVPPVAYFLVSAIFHYLGPAFAVLLFAEVEVLGVAWLRIASAAVIFALWRHPWQLYINSTWKQRRLLFALGSVLAVMNACFYLAISRLPLGSVGAIEFIGQIFIAAVGIRSRRNLLALGFAIAGGGLLTNVQLEGQFIGFVFAFANCIFFMLYSVIPYITDQLAMARLPRATFALMLSLLPAIAVGIGTVILGQVPTGVEIIGILMIMCGVAVHQPS